jgi:flagellar biosynthesis protein FlhG
MARIIPIASGKGGVGKSTMVANLGIALGKAGKTVLLVDLDLGGSNLHTCLGVNNPKLGLSQFIYKKVDHIEDLIVETPYPKVYLIAGDGLIPGTANIPFFIKRKLIKELQGMVADFVLLDLGAGTTNNTLDFFLMSPTAMLVTVPETTAILNAYSFLKSALYRALFPQL